MSGQANEYETVARYKKARKIADTLKAAGLTESWQADDVDVRHKVIALTGVREPSEVTWELVKYLLTEGR